MVSEVALSLVLLIGAGLMIRSFWKLQNVDPGFNTSNALTMSVDLTPIRYSEPQQQLAFLDRAIEQIRAVPGVVSVGSYYHRSAGRRWIDTTLQYRRPAHRDNRGAADGPDALHQP